MSYSHQMNVVSPPTATAGSDLYAAAADWDQALGTAEVIMALPILGGIPVTVKRICAQVVTTFDTAATVLTVSRRPTPGSDVGKVALGTLTIPNTAAAPNVYYKDLDSAKISPGEELVVESDGGTSAGTAIVSLALLPAWDAPTNNPKMIASV